MTLAQQDFCIMLSSTQDWLQPALHHNFTLACMCSKTSSATFQCCKRNLEATLLPETLADQWAWHVCMMGQVNSAIVGTSLCLGMEQNVSLTYRASDESL